MKQVTYLHNENTGERQGIGIDETKVTILDMSGSTTGEYESAGYGNRKGSGNRYYQEIGMRISKGWKVV